MARYPVHVTMRAVRSVPSLRREGIFAFLARALRASNKPAFRVVHFSVQQDHVHLRTPAGIDPRSSGAAFDGWVSAWSSRRGRASFLAHVVTSPRTWLAVSGWRRAGGLLDPRDGPAPAPPDLRAQGASAPASGNGGGDHSGWSRSVLRRAAAAGVSRISTSALT